MLEKCNIVVVGSINPAIFHPEWFERYSLLPSQDIQWAFENAEEKKLEPEAGLIIKYSRQPIIVSSDNADVTFPSVKLIANRERIQCMTHEENKFKCATELATKILSVLPHTPVTAVGINFLGSATFECSSGRFMTDVVSGNARPLQELFGDDYIIYPRIVLQREDSRIAFRFMETAGKDRTISFDVNFHREVLSHKAEDAVKIINKNFSSDLNWIKPRIKKLLGGKRKKK